MKDTYERFAREHPRDPLPVRLTWETDRTPGTERASWLVIDRLKPPDVEAARLPDVNDYEMGSIANFGIRSSGTRVTSVQAGSNAESFGLKPGDTIAEIKVTLAP